MDDMIKAVRDHAIAHYEEGGWDVLVECWTDHDIAEAISGARTVMGAIAKVKRQLDDYDDYRKDVQDRPMDIIEQSARTGQDLYVKRLGPARGPAERHKYDRPGPARRCRT